MIAPIKPFLAALALSAVSLFCTTGLNAEIITFSNNQLITIRDNNVADPFPSVISVSSVPFVPVKLTVTVTGITHSYINDMAMAIVSPQGVKVLLVSGTGPEGGQESQSNLPSVTNLTWTFDDYADSQLPQSTTPVSGTFKPGMRLDDYFDNFLTYGVVDTFDTNFTRQIGLDPTGDWLLLVRDSQRVDRGTIGGGWSISFFDEVSAVPEPCSFLLAMLAIVPLARRRLLTKQETFVAKY